MRLRISARKSDLARLQAYMVGDALKNKHPHLEIEYRFKESLGDKNLTEPLWKIPEKGVFTEDFYGELLRHETDMVVHSWKDLPTEEKSDTVIAATLPRADQRDLLLLKKSHFSRLHQTRMLRVFSSSPRREYNLTTFFKEHLPFGLTDVKFESVRGNIPTRLRKLLESSEVDGLIVAKAALDRLLTAPAEEFSEVRGLLKSYLQELEWAALPLTINPNAAAQGALAVEVRSDREDLKELLKAIHDPATFACAVQERKILSSYGGGCHQKIGVAVLQRPYGEITLLKGLTDQGQVLSQRRLQTPEAPPRFFAEQMWTSTVHADRVPHPVAPLKEFNAFYVSRVEAWVDEALPQGLVWAAGIKTWKNLAQKGIWVHGCNEGLGEREETRLEVLAGVPLKWAKLSHDEGYASAERGMKLISTYTLKPVGPITPTEGKESFFWSSGSQFLHVFSLHPEIALKHHACGPGNTYNVIRTELEKVKDFDPKRLRIFLDQEDWRQQCTM